MSPWIVVCTFLFLSTGIAAENSVSVGVQGGYTSRLIFRGFDRGTSGVTLDVSVATPSVPVSISLSGACIPSPFPSYTYSMDIGGGGNLGAMLFIDARLVGRRYGPKTPVFGSDTASSPYTGEMALELTYLGDRVRPHISLAYDPFEGGIISTFSIARTLTLWPTLPTTAQVTAGINSGYHISGTRLSDVSISIMVESHGDGWMAAPFIGFTFAPYGGGLKDGHTTRGYRTWAGISLGILPS